jgi:hypothetical protein
VRCSRCGNENPETNRFCGMCGELLVPAASTPVTAPVRSAPLPTATPASAPAPVTQPSIPPSGSQPSVTQNLAKPASPRSYPPVAEQQVPAISGPSFLGLNQPAPARGTKSDPHLEHSSRSLDYLLEDEEEPKRGLGKILLALVALALVLGFGYLRWRGQGLDWLASGPKKPAAATQPADALPPADASQPGSSAPAPSSSESSSAPATPPPAAATPPVSSGSGTDAAASPTTNSSSSNPGAAASTPAATPAANPPATTKDQPDTAPVSDSAAAGKSENTDEPEAAPPSAPKPRPTAKPSPARAVDPVTEAEKYIYGRDGVRQDCDRGLKLLRPSAEKANPKAMISLGALYSAGLCTPHDLPTAYRWFALALRKQPDNQAVQTDLQKLWSEMTPPERQLAIKLSQ